MKALLEKMTVEDLPPTNFKKLGEVIGMNFIKELFVKYPGMTFRVPKTLSKIYCRKYIQKHFQGNNHKAMALELGIDERTVYRHLNARAEKL